MPKSINTVDEYELITHSDTSLAPDLIARIRAWLEPTDYLADSGEFRRHLLSQAPGTGLWICQTDEYKIWHDSPDHGSLWIKGAPGAGKSVTAASIIHHLRTTEPESPVLFFFFRNIVASNFSPRALIQDWLAQLLPHSPTLQHALKPRLDTNLSEVSDNELVDLFLDGVSCVPKLYCVGDALDEMTTENRPFLDRLNQLTTYRPRSLKLLFTSRPNQNLQSALRDSSIVHISLQQQLVDADITSYLHHRIDTAMKSAVQQPARQGIIEMVTKRSEGLFLYAKLTMDQIEASLDAESMADIEQLEKALPMNLEQMYVDMLTKQRNKHHVSVDLQVLVLEAVTHASRPLRLFELADLMGSIYPDVADYRQCKTLVANCCGPLVEILEDETLQIIHHSCTEFLRGDKRNINAIADFPVLHSATAHKHMAIRCLGYLQSGKLLLPTEISSEHSPDQTSEYKTSPLDGDSQDDDSSTSQSVQTLVLSSSEYQEARLRHPFLHYAVQNWTYHASLYDIEDEELYSIILSFIEPESLAFQRWLGLEWGLSRTNIAEAMPTTLHIAAYCGLSKLALKSINEETHSVSVVDAQCRTPLHWAAKNGHAQTVALLLQHGSEADPDDARGLKPIHLAALNNHGSVVRLLLEAGVKPDTPKTRENHSGRLQGGEAITKGRCAILYASQGGYLETVEAMIPYCQEDVLQRLLCECCRFGRTDCVLAILEKSNVSANATYRNACALYFACSQPNVKVVEALLRRGADVNAESQYHPVPVRNGPRSRAAPISTPLHQLVKNWHDDNNAACQAIFMMLLKAGADLNRVDGRGNTPLLLAAGGPYSGFANKGDCHIHALKALLESRVDVSKTVDGMNALHLILDVTDNLEAVQLLVEHGCDPNQKDERGDTALHNAMQRNYNRYTDASIVNAIIDYLLQQGVLANLNEQDGASILRKAMSFGLDVFKKILSRYNDQNAKLRCWFALGQSTRGSDGKFEDFVKLLLAEGVDINVQNNYGRTLYLNCLDSIEQLRFLSGIGARTDVVDNHGRNALHLAVQSERSKKSLEELISETGLDPCSTDAQGNTLLHYAAQNYKGEPEHAEYIQWLLSLGIPFSAMNNDKRTALHVFLTKRRCTNTLFSHKRVHFINVAHISDDAFNTLDKDGLGAVHLAAMRSGRDLAILKNAGADVGLLTSDSQNVLHIACRARQPDIISQILDCYENVDIEQKDSFNRTPLHNAACSGEPESVAALLRRGADSHARDMGGRTPLHAVAEFKIEQTLWDAHEKSFDSSFRGPSVDALRPASQQVSYTRKRPWYLYKYGKPICDETKTYFDGATTIARLLVDAGADTAAHDDNELTPLDVALQLGCPEVTEVLGQEALFMKATNHMESDKDANKRSEEVRQYMKTQILLTRPKSSLQILGQDHTLMHAVRENPTVYLNLFTIDDAATIINDGFTKDTANMNHHLTLRELIEHNHIEVLHRVPDLVRYFSAQEAVEEVCRAARTNKKQLHDKHCMTALQLACSQTTPRWLIVQYLVEKHKVDVNEHIAEVAEDNHDPTARFVTSGTAVHILASADSWWHVEMLKYIIEKGANVNALDRTGQTPLHVAARGVLYNRDQTIDGTWRIEAVRTLISNGADVNIIDAKGRSVLENAATAPEIMRELLHHGADPSISTSNPIFRTIFEQNLGAMEALLDHGVSVDSRDEHCQSEEIDYNLKKSRKVYALLCAAFAQQLNRHVPETVPLFKSLVIRGANLHLALNDDETLVHFLFEYPEYEILDTLLQDDCAQRIDFDSCDQHGRTVLMAACKWRCVLPGYSHKHWDPKATGPPLRILDLGADATLVDEQGKTALHHLLENNGMPDDVLVDFIQHDKVASILHVKDYAGYSPLHYALRNLRPEICTLLLSKGANLLEADPQGWTALHYIATRCLATYIYPAAGGRLRIDFSEDHFDQCLAVWKRYLAEGGDINVSDDAGITPLHVFLASKEKEAARNDTDNISFCHISHFDKLFPEDSGVDVFATNKEGETVLHIIAKRSSGHYAARDGHDKGLFEFFKDKGLDPLIEDAKGRSALDVASACGNDHIVMLMERK